MVSKVCKYKNFYKESYVSWLISVGQDGPEEKYESHNLPRVTIYRCLTPCPWVLGSEGSILLIKSILCSRTYNDSIDPFINTQQSLASESPPPSRLLYPWLDQPTFSPVTLIYSPHKHNLVIHTILAHCTFYTFCPEDLLSPFTPNTEQLFYLVECSHLLYR